MLTPSSAGIWTQDLHHRVTGACMMRLLNLWSACARSCGMWNVLWSHHNIQQGSVRVLRESSRVHVQRNMMSKNEVKQFLKSLNSRWSHGVWRRFSPSRAGQGLVCPPVASLLLRDRWICSHCFQACRLTAIPLYALGGPTGWWPPKFSSPGVPEVPASQKPLRVYIFHLARERLWVMWSSRKS